MNKRYSEARLPHILAASDLRQLWKPTNFDELADYLRRRKTTHGA